MSFLHAPSDFNPGSYFTNFDDKGIPELHEAKRIMTILLKEVVKKWWKLDEPLIVGIHSWPGRWKSHLIAAFEKWLQDAGVQFCSSHKDEYLLTQKKSEYWKHWIIISDDLLQWTSALPRNIKDTSNSWWYDFQALPDLLFDIYDWKKIWIVSSNFDIAEILDRVAESDTVGRLKSRVRHLLASVQPINLDTAPDHREVLAQQWTRAAQLFSKKVDKLIS